MWETSFQIGHEWCARCGIVQVRQALTGRKTSGRLPESFWDMAIVVAISTKKEE